MAQCFWQLTAQRPVIFKFIEMIRKEEELTQYKLSQAAAGKTTKLTRKKYRQINTNLLRLVESYRADETESIPFLRSISHNIS